MAVTSAGLMFARVLYLDPDPDKLAMMGPALLWPVWGAALAVAAAAYRIRRRGDCRTCSAHGSHGPHTAADGLRVGD
ncbi:hypothetical protein [Dactylosporangium sp. NPDC050588]|uniref:hypothetical protein n=1 Tax=Dactylosporangium sp. NPDC050588 TaxID=3157211 RepID=UPI0033F6B767